MVKIYQIKKIHKEFLEALEQGTEEIKLGDDEISVPTLENQNFFQEKFEEANLPLSKKIISEDTTLTLSGKGKLILEVVSDCNLMLNFEGKELSFLDMILVIKEGVKLSLVEFSKNTQLYKTLSIILEENSKLLFGQYIDRAKVNTTSVYLQKNSEYNLVSSYFAKDNDYYIINEARHLEKNSSSNMDVYGVAQDKARVISDGLVYIDQVAHNSSGHQNLKGLLLDKESSISCEPILEVFTNDVSCSHGASVTQIAEQVQFYLKSRGLNEDEIKNLVIQSLVQRILSLFDSQDVLFKEIEKKLTL